MEDNIIPIAETPSPEKTPVDEEPNSFIPETAVETPVSIF